jgi:hypothetical protein
MGGMLGISGAHGVFCTKILGKWTLIMIWF